MNPLTCSFTPPIFDSKKAPSVQLNDLIGPDKKIRESGLKALRGGNQDDWDTDFPESLEKWIVPTPPNTPLSELVLFKDSYSGQIPLNGIKESEFQFFNDLLQKIEEGKTQMKVKGTPEFHQKILEHCQKLCTRESGRALFRKLLEPKQLKLFVVKELTFKDGEKNFSTDLDEAPRLELLNPLIGEPHVFVPLKSESLFFVGVELGKRTKILVRFPSYVLFAHELIHLTHSLKDDSLKNTSCNPTLDPAYDNLEEQVTITGLKDNITLTEPGPIDEEWTPLENAYDPLNENRISCSFNETIRFGHHGARVSEISVINRDYILALNELLTKETGFEQDKQNLLKALTQFFDLFIHSEALQNAEEAEKCLVFAIHLPGTPFFAQLWEKGARFSIQNPAHFESAIEHNEPLVKEELLKMLAELAVTPVHFTEYLKNRSWLRLAVKYGDEALLDKLWKNGVKFTLEDNLAILFKEVNIKLIECFARNDSELITLKLLSELAESNNVEALKVCLKHNPSDQHPFLLTLLPNCASLEAATQLVEYVKTFDEDDVFYVFSFARQVMQAKSYTILLPILNSLKEKGWNPNARGPAGNTLLHFAVENRASKADLDALIALGIDPNLTNRKGEKAKVL